MPAAVSDRSRWRAVRAYVALTHLTPILAVMLATLACALVAAVGMPPLGRLGALLGAMLGGQVAVGAINEAVDAATDARVKPTKPIPAGDASVRGALILAAAGLLMMLVCGAWLGAAPLALVTLGNGLGIAYSLWFKRTPLSWLPYLLALPLLPIWVLTVFDRFEPALLMLYPLGACATLAVHVAQSVPDVAADRAAGVRNLSAALGEKRSLVLCWAAILLSAGLAVVAAPAMLPVTWPVRVGALASLVLVVADALLYRLRPRLGLMAAFPVVAGSAAILGVAWVLAITR